MLFAAHYALSPQWFNAPGLEFDDVDLCLEDLKFRLTIQTREHTEDPSEDPFTDILILAICEEDLSEEVRPIFAAHSILKGSSTDDAEPILTAPAPHFSDLYWKFLSDVQTKLDAEANRLFGILRWRTGIRGGPPDLRSNPKHLKWRDGDLCSVDAKSLAGWQSLPHGIRVGIEDTPELLVLTEAQKASILDLAGSGEPLGHDLLQEAWRLVDSNPRSALTTAIAAVETRIKELIADLVPDNAWLLENLPSPPIDRLVREYLEKLPARCTIDGKVLRPNRQVISRIKWGIEQRNRLVHGRGTTPDSEQVKDLLEKTRDLLYLLDYYAGHEWAKDFIKPWVWEEA